MHAHYYTLRWCSIKLEPETAVVQGGLSEISAAVAALMDGWITRTVLTFIRFR